MKPPTFSPAAFLARYDAMDRELVAAGFPATSPWWRAQIERFIQILGSRLDEQRRRSLLRRWIIRAGRRSGKSTTISRLLVAWVLFGSWYVPPGDVGVVAIVSVDRGEAAARLRTVGDVLRALNVEFTPRADELELLDRRVVFRVFTCSITGVVGFTAIAVFCDEVALWSNRETGQNPAKLVVQQLSPTLATQAFGFSILSSAVWTKDDFHAKCFDEGDTQNQIVSAATTWEANPTLSEADTRALEPVLEDWLCAYANVPREGVLGDFFSELALRNSIDSDQDRHFLVRGTHNVVTADTAFTGNGDNFGVVVCSHEEGDWIPTDDGFKRDLSLVRVHETHAWRADRSPREMARRLKHEVCDRYGTTRIIIDEHEASSFQELAQDVGLQPKVQKWTGGDHVADNWHSARDREVMSKTQRYKLVRTAMLDGRVRIPSDRSLIAEFRTIYSEVTPSGNEVVRARRTAATGHADRISALVLGVSIALVRRPHAVPERWSAEDYHRARLEWNVSKGCDINAYHPVFNYGGTRRGVCLEWPDFVRLIKNRAQRISPPKAA